MEFAGGRKLVVPGEIIEEGMELLPGPGTYRQGKYIRSLLLGLAEKRGRLIRVIPLSGRYIPKAGDDVIGIVEEVKFSNWVVDINSPYKAIMLLSDALDQYVDLGKESLTKYFNVGDTIICRIKNVDDNMNVFVTVKGPGLRKLREGRIIEVDPVKIPRIIGKQASMIKMIKEYTKSRIFVGQNGRIWINGGNEDLAIKVIKIIEREAHISGLTDRIRQILEEEAGRKEGGADNGEAE